MPEWSFDIGTPPYLDGYNPTPGQTEVELNTSIIVHIKDTETFVDISTLDAYVNGSDAYRASLGGFQAPFSGSITGPTNDRTLTINTSVNYPFDQSIITRIVVDDYGGNTLDAYWSFTTLADGYAPFLDGYDPYPNDIDVPRISSVSFNVLDELSVVKLDTIDAYVDGYLAIDNGSIQSLFNGPDAYYSPVNIDGYDGYAFTLDYINIYEADKQIDVRVLAEDSIGNQMDTTYSFFTLEEIPPLVVNENPAQYEEEVLINNSIITFDVVSQFNLLLDTFSIYIEDQLAFNGSIQSPFNGPDAYYTTTSYDGYDGYKFVFDYNDLWDAYQQVDIRVIAQDDYGNSLDETWWFKTEHVIYYWEFSVADYILPWIDNEYPTGSGIGRDKLISFDILDDYSGLNTSLIDAYVNGNIAFSGPNTFYSPYNGVSSSISETNVDGYDGYHIVLDNINNFDSGGSYLVRVVAYDNYGNSIDESFSFSVEDYISPWIDAYSPTGTGIDLDTNIIINVLDDYSGVNVDTINTYVNGNLAFSGPNTFYSPYNDVNSAISTTNIDGYDGYNIVIDRSSFYEKGIEYTIRTTANDYYGNAMDESFSFTGTDFYTDLVDVSIGPYEITIDLTFDTDMLDDINLRNPANYHFDGYWTYARKVEVLSSTQIRLWVELLYNYDDFVVRVDPAVKNSIGESLVNDSYGFSIFKSDATFTNYNGLVRTWHDSGIISSDTQRVYLAGTKGIDVYRKYGETEFFRWAQIFDGYGIDAMHVANYPSDLEITDEVSPVLQDQTPPPSSYAAPNTRISFKVVDSITTVEITSLLVYINGEIAFKGGYGGWDNGWSGRIEIEHHQLSVEMWYETNFNSGDVVTVRVIAQDLMGNELDSSYSFNIITSFDGFGGSPFGTSPFGGV